MCGILAVFCKNWPSCLEQIKQSGEELSKRGPDSASLFYSKDGIYVFHRLCINDTSILGSQPFELNITKDGITRKVIMMCNGEIYNHLELEEEFDIQCDSTSDCEIIIRLYEKIGFAETYKRLYGVFAIVLIDDDKVYIARDRVGVRPLFIGMTTENELAVASVPHALLRFCKSVMPFFPGLCAVHEKNSKDVLTYLCKDQIGSGKLDNVSNNIREYLKDAVKMRVNCDRPIGCLLSGGLDSSIIAFLLVELLGPEKVRTYSIGMEGSVDLKYAKIVADFLGTTHTQVLFTPEEGIQAIPEVIKTLASYDITTVRASVGMYLLSKYISENTDDRVIFSGEGSDELLYGYLYFHYAPSPEEAEKESLDLVQKLHFYDVLRADRTVSANGLELRVPFLDKNFVDLVFSLPSESKLPIARIPEETPIEKYILRKAFDGCLPDEIIWRQKCAFSDGVSNSKKSWFEYIQDFANQEIPNSIFNPLFPSKEAMYYKLIFDRYFPTYNFAIPYWMPKWTNAIDPSARTLQICKE